MISSMIRCLSKAVAGTMTLEQIQTELRAVSGTPLRSEVDAVYRRELWQQLDRLVRVRG
jgi:hypothetical protein